MRHAKAEKAVKHAWDPAEDKNRQLSASGMGDAAAVGRWFRNRGSIPGLALVSPARRAVQTWEIAAREMGAALPARFEPDLYGAEVSNLLHLVRSLPPEFTSAIVVGHNPSLSELIGEDLATCALARLELPEWAALNPDPRNVKVRKIRGDDDGE
ncbi:MAG TPA: histidine phosphatase family protein [Candidatus Nanopelagicaceae bacterium]|nr:histidine phosphatase family protein [Candidatus Nanopelagicaceae bacterium]